MNHKEQDHILIQQYLDGSLEADARQQLENRLKQEPELQQLLDLYKDVDHSLSNETVQNYRSLIKNLQEEKKKDKRKTRRLWPRYLLIAASIALVAMFLVWIYTPQNTAEPDTLFAQNFNPEPQFSLPEAREVRTQDSTATDTSQIGTIDPNWSKALERYQEDQIPAAIATMEQVNPQIQVEYASTYYLQLGLLYIRNQQFKEGISTLEKISDTSKDAEWNIALAWLKVDVNQARILLKEISEANNYKSQEASNILRRLKD